MFAVLYRWRLKPGTENDFRAAWRDATTGIRAHYGTSGSRLQRTDENELVGYAVWPSRARWEEAQGKPPVDADASARMRACIEESFAATPLEVLEDMLG